VDETMGVICHQHVVDGGVGLFDRIVLIFPGIGIVAPPVAYNEDAWSLRQFDLVFRHVKRAFQSIATETRQGLVPLDNLLTQGRYDSGLGRQCQTYPALPAALPAVSGSFDRSPGSGIIRPLSAIAKPSLGGL